MSLLAGTLLRIQAQYIYCWVNQEDLGPEFSTQLLPKMLLESLGLLMRKNPRIDTTVGEQHRRESILKQNHTLQM